MALYEIEVEHIENAMDDFLGRIRPPANVRSQLDFTYRLEGQSIKIFEVRPQWMNPEKKTEISFAKVTFVKNQGIWEAYWRRDDGKWHRYDPNAKVKTLKDILSIIENDEYGCFFG